MTKGVKNARRKAPDGDKNARNLRIETTEKQAAKAKQTERMIERLEVVHYAVSLGHHRSLVCWIPTEMLMASTFRLSPEAERKYRSFAGDGVFRLSAGIEDAEDICADLERVLG